MMQLSNEAFNEILRAWGADRDATFQWNAKGEATTDFPCLELRYQKGGWLILLVKTAAQSHNWSCLLSRQRLSDDNIQQFLSVLTEGFQELAKVERWQAWQAFERAKFERLAAIEAQVDNRAFADAANKQRFLDSEEDKALESLRWEFVEAFGEQLFAA